MGPRGEGWVVGQIILITGIIITSWITRFRDPLLIEFIGLTLCAVGIAIFFWGARSLGTNLTALPKPKADSKKMVTTGVYQYVRHPIYSGLTLATLGWSLFWGSFLSLGLSLALALWLDFKAREEENWLLKKYPAYKGYSRRVKKLIPFIY